MQNLRVVITQMDTTNFLNEQILASTGLPKHQQRLIFGTELEDGRTLGSYGVQLGATVHMAVDVRDWEAFVFQIFVKMPTNSNTILLKVTASDSVQYVKRHPT